MLKSSIVLKNCEVKESYMSSILPSSLLDTLYLMNFVSVEPVMGNSGEQETWVVGVFSGSGLRKNGGDSQELVSNRSKRFRCLESKGSR